MSITDAEDTPERRARVEATLAGRHDDPPELRLIRPTKSNRYDRLMCRLFGHAWVNLRPSRMMWQCRECGRLTSSTARAEGPGYPPPRRS